MFDHVVVYEQNQIICHLIAALASLFHSFISQSHLKLSNYALENQMKKARDADFLVLNAESEEKKIGRLLVHKS